MDTSNELIGSVESRGTEGKDMEEEEKEIWQFIHQMAIIEETELVLCWDNIETQ
jgi:hypothetical protein